MGWADEAKKVTAKGDVIPAGWKTSREIAAENGWSEPYARAVIVKAVRAGTAEAKAFRVNTGLRVQRIPFYKLRKS
jgi:hypothetical protein